MSDTILIVDDSLTVRMDLAEAFRAAGFEVELCASGAELRAQLARQPPALLVLDVVLPDADGVELLAEVRRSERLSNLPIVLLSTEAEVADRVRGLKMGASEYVGKPYEAAHVVGRAAALLRPASSARRELTVLVIDDSLTFREELGAELRQAGYRAILAESGQEGLRRAAASQPDVVIVDGVLDDMEGTAVVRRLRLDPGLQSVPCLLLTANEGVQGEVMALDAGADAYVRKTEGSELVLAKLAAVLRGAEASRERARGSSLLGPKRILAVDDSPTYLEQLTEHLRQDGYEVIKATSGEAALELLAVEPVDCVLLDLMMPGLSGTETCSRIKASSALRTIPLIMLTARDDQAAMIEGINAGADDYVSKSANFEVLLARLRAQLRRKQFEDENRHVRDELFLKETEATAARKVAEAQQALLEELASKNDALAYHVGELERLNGELQIFAYSVSHDLRQPLRGMDGFSRALLDKYGDKLDEQGRHYLRRVRAGAERMAELINGLLTLSRVSQKTLEKQRVRLDELAERIIERLREAEPDRRLAVNVAPRLQALGDSALLESALENLLGNAWKFTAKVPEATIEVGEVGEGPRTTFFVRDNGAGFDMTYAEKLFGPFQRLHSAEEYEGTGIGLATVQRIVHRHGGRIWAESAPGCGATFFFHIPEGSLH